MEPVDLLVVGAGQLVTMAGASERPKRGADLREIGAVADGALAARDGVIVDVGPAHEVLARVTTSPKTRVLDARGAAVIPGFVDSHTHLVFGGSREDEFALRVAGATYQEIMAAGGGIMNSVKATRAASQGEMVEQALRELDGMLLTGTTTVEAKSGYGLDLATELKQLRAIQELQARHPMDVVPTFLGAHEVAPEYRGRADEYVDLLIREMLPAVQAQGLARYCDVFCEKGVFTPEQTRRIFAAARDLGFALKLHADELSDLSGAQIAVEYGATSADHLLCISDESIWALAGSSTMATLLPGTAFYLKMPYARARAMVEAGCAVALASDFNPGSCPTYNMGLVITLACLGMALTPEEALAAATINGAHALGIADRVGSLEVGKQADLVILNASSHRHIPYRGGTGVVRTVVKRGVVVVEDGRLVR
jgi:imidazolonepropionase